MGRHPQPKPTDDEREAEALHRAAEAPLFADAGSGDYDSIDIHRLEPSEEMGWLGKLTPGATEEDIRKRFGGGQYKLQLKNSKKEIKGTKTLQLVGDTVFVSSGAEALYRRRVGLPPLEAKLAAAAPAQPSFGPEMFMTLLSSMQRMQAEADERRQREADKRADQEAKDRDRREDQRRRDDEAREARLRTEQAEQRERDRAHQTQTMQFFQAMLAAKQGPPPAGDGTTILEAFTNGMKTMLQLQPKPAEPNDDEGDDEGDGAQDPMAAAISMGVKTLVDKIAGGNATAAAPTGPAPTEAGNGDVTVTGPMADELRGLVIAAQAAGVDPNAILMRGIKSSRASLQKKLAPAPPAAAAAPADPVAAAVPLPAPAPAGNPIAEAAARVAAQKRNGTSSAQAG